MFERSLDAIAAGIAIDRAFGAALRKAGRGEARRIATTEVAAAFNQGQLAVFRDVARLDSYLATEMRPAMIWNAYLDSCPTCWDADGDTVFADESFPEGIPGLVHVSCRCYADATLLPADTSTPIKS